MGKLFKTMEILILYSFQYNMCWGEELNLTLSIIYIHILMISINSQDYIARNV